MTDGGPGFGAERDRTILVNAYAPAAYRERLEQPSRSPIRTGYLRPRTERRATKEAAAVSPLTPGAAAGRAVRGTRGEKALNARGLARNGEAVARVGTWYAAVPARASRHAPRATGAVVAATDAEVLMGACTLGTELPEEDSAMSWIVRQALLAAAVS